ncbi:MAG: hypothetical protein HY925_12535 [Elusimicrobia bacterium]|nr:hypothetical protein [Elusimicrobiota bacterium]
MRKSSHRVLAAALFLLAPAARADVYDKLAKKLVDPIDGKKKEKAAVLPFAYADGRNSPGGRIVSEALATAIAGRDEAVLVERGQIDSAMKEISLSFTGMISSGSALQAGRMVGAKYLVLGTLADDGEKRVEVNARLVETESGIVLAAGKATVKKTWRDYAPVDATGGPPLSVTSIVLPATPGTDLMVQAFGERRVMIEYVNTEGRPHLRLTDVTDPKKTDSDEVAVPFDAESNRFRKMYPKRVKLHGRRYLLWSGVWKPETGPVIHMAPLKGVLTDATVGDQEVLFDFLDLERRWTELVSRSGHFLGDRDGLNLVAYFERLPKAKLRVSLWSIDAENTLSRVPSGHTTIDGKRGEEVVTGLTEVGTRHFRFRYDADTDRVTVEEP